MHDEPIEVLSEFERIALALRDVARNEASNLPFLSDMAAELPPCAGLDAALTAMRARAADVARAAEIFHHLASKEADVMALMPGLPGATATET